MKYPTIGIIAAMKEEISPFLKKVGSHSSETVGSFRIIRFTIGRKRCVLVKSGMGPRKAAEAASMIIASEKPELIINFGFAGALSANLQVGDIIIASRLLLMHDSLFAEQKGLYLPNEISMSSNTYNKCAFITTAKITGKSEMAARIPKDIDTAVVEMESAAVAKACQSHNIPLIAIRSVSDGTDEELGFSLDEFCDSNLDIKIWRVMLTIARKPWIIPQLIRLSGNTGIAGNRLAEAVQSLILNLDMEADE